MPDDSACCNVHGGLNIRMSSATGCTREHVAPALAERAALGARLTSICRVNVLDLDSATRSFIGNEGLQLPKRPAGHHPVGVPVADLAPLPNIFEPFHPNNPGLRVFGFGNDGLAEIVVRPRNMAALPPRESAQYLAGTAVVSGLEGCANFVAPVLKLLPAGPAIQRAVRGRGSISDAEVNAHGRSIGRRGVFVFDNDVDLPSASGPDHNGSSRLLPRQCISLIITQDQRDMNASATRKARADAR